ncbi:MAG: hypothetical protein IKG27_03715 [Bacilli bacterium]|nr:hypothetical protein [Bacilli bacterium]
MNDYVKEIKMVENGLVIILLFVIIIILLPSVTTMASKSMQVAAEANTAANVEFVKELYTTINLNDNIGLPFKVIYDKNGYKIYSNGIRYKKEVNINIDSKNKLPTRGSIEIESDGYTIVKNLKFGSYTCSQIREEDIICER